MPVTLLAHQAPVLPLKLRWPGRFDGLALVVGSMMPDAWYVSEHAGYSPWGQPLWRDGHQLDAIVQQVVLPSMLVAWVLRRYVLPSVPRAFGATMTYRHGDLAHVSAGSPRWWVTAYSALLGGLTHLALDALAEFTGEAAWLLELSIDVVLVVLAVRYMRRIRRQRWLRHWAPTDVVGVPPPLGRGAAIVVRVGLAIGLITGGAVGWYRGSAGVPGGNVRVGLMTAFVLTTLWLMLAGVVATWMDLHASDEDAAATDYQPRSIQASS